MKLSVISQSYNLYKQINSSDVPLFNPFHPLVSLFWVVWFHNPLIKLTGLSLLSIVQSNAFGEQRRRMWRDTNLDECLFSILFMNYFITNPREHPEIPMNYLMKSALNSSRRSPFPLEVDSNLFWIFSRERWFSFAKVGWFMGHDL